MNMDCDHHGVLQIGIDFLIPFLYKCSCFDGKGQGTPDTIMPKAQSIVGNYNNCTGEEGLGLA